MFAAGASVDPGEYVVKLAVADGDRVGSLEIPVHASLEDAGAIKLSQLLAGGPVPPGDPLRPTIGPRVSFGSVQGYLEAYGPNGGALQVEFEIAADESGPVLLGADVPPRPVSDDRTLFSQMMVVQRLPPGSYRLRVRALVSAGGTPIKTLTRAFEVAAPPMARESADLFLPDDADALAPPFLREEALDPVTLEVFRDRLPAATREGFEQGLTHLRNSRFAEAGASFRNAIRPGLDSSAALAYLAVCLATTGHDAEAAEVWREALTGDDVPQIQRWIGDALMRRMAFGEARSVFDEAARRWPADARFTRPRALLEAISGRGRDAVRTMERVISDNPADRDAVFLGLEWLFNLRRAGIVVHSQAEDLQLARTYGALYAKANGPYQPLAQRWLDYLER